MKLNIQFNIKNLLNNSIVVYLVFFAAFVNLMDLYCSKNYITIIFFIIVALIVNSLSKNMTIILGSSIIVTYVTGLFINFNSIPSLE